MDLRKELIRAGFMYDGHVTIGSLEEQIKVIQDWLAHPENYTDIMPGSIPLPCPVATQKTSGKFYCTRENGHEGPCAAHPVNHKKSVMTFIREEN